jgi:hypothetical protein
VAIWCLGSNDELMGAAGELTRATGFVVVGMALGSRGASGDLGWALGEPRVRIDRGAGPSPRPFLGALRAAVARAAAQKAPQLVACRECQEIVGPESRYDATVCLSCAGRVVGIAG